MYPKRPRENVTSDEMQERRSHSDEKIEFVFRVAPLFEASGSLLTFTTHTQCLRYSSYAPSNGTVRFLSLINLPWRNYRNCRRYAAIQQCYCVIDWSFLCSWFFVSDFRLPSIKYKWSDRQIKRHRVCRLTDETRSNCGGIIVPIPGEEEKWSTDASIDFNSSLWRILARRPVIS